MAVQDEIGIHESSINQNPNGTILVIFCAGPTFVKEICRSASTYFPYFKAISVQIYWT